jgi:transposase
LTRSIDSFIAEDVTAAQTAKAKPDLSAIEAEIRRLGASDELCRLLLGLLASMSDQVHSLQSRLDTALRHLYVRKSEKISSEQLLLFLSKLPGAEAGQIDVETAPPPAPDDGPVPDDKAKPKGKPHGKRAFPAHLPRRTEKVLVPEAERRCSCGADKICIGYETQVLWEFDPAQFFLLERQREKLACKTCEENGVQTAPAPGKPIEGGRPGPGLLAQIVTAKEHDSTPLYRQSKIYQRGGIHLAPSTLGDWHAAAADLCEPLWRELRRDALTSYLLSLDDTHMPVLDRDDPRGRKKGHIWTYIGDERRVAFCHYTPNWSGTFPQKVLEEFSGHVIQGDGYAGIDDVFKGPDPPVRAGCMDHSRRKFVKALEGGDVRAAVVVKLMRDLYAVEEQARMEKLDAEALRVRRQERSRPLMDRLHRVIADLHAGVVPKSPLGKATTYAINQWPTLEVFLDDGRVPIANAHVERQQRRTAIGRHNYLFAGNDEGARRLAILQTIVVNCDLLGISMWHYLRDTFQRLADGWPQSRIAELLPAAWAATQKAQQADAQ